MILLDGPTAAKESNKEDDTSHNNKEDWCGEELVTKEIKILTVGTLNHSASHNQEQSRKLKL